MGLVVGKWRIKQRKQPIGGRALLLFLHFGGTELFLMLAVVVTIVMQFRRKLLAIVSKLFQEIDAYDCFDMPCHSEPGVPLPWVLFWTLLAGLTIFSLWKNRGAQRLIFHYVLPILALFAATVFAVAVFIHETSIWLYAALIVFKVGVFSCCFFEIEKVQDNPSAGQTSSPPKRALPLELEGSKGLQVAWAGLLAFGLVLWFSSEIKVPGDRSISSFGTTQGGVHGMPVRTKDWLAAIDKKQLGSVRELSMSSDAKKIFQDPVWGKFLFFSATDSSPEVLELILKQDLVPNEFIEHSFTRLASMKNCQAFDRLVRYGKFRNIRKPVNISCSI